MSKHSCFRPTLLLAAFLAACSGGGGESPDASNGGGESSDASGAAGVVATEAESGRAFQLRVGQQLEIRLHGNDTTDPPTSWSFDGTQGALRMTRAEVVADDPRADGAGATSIFRFTAAAPGREELVFDGGAPGRRATFTVTIGN